MAYKRTAETADYEPQEAHEISSGAEASYTPDANINPFAYGKSGGKAACLGNVPGVQVGGSFEVGAVPAMPGTLKIGDNKNVSTPVSG